MSFIQRCKRCGHEDVRSHEDGVGPCRGYTQSYDDRGLPCGCSITGCDCPGFVPQDAPQPGRQHDGAKEDRA